MVRTEREQTEVQTCCYFHRNPVLVRPLPVPIDARLPACTQISVLVDQKLTECRVWCIRLETRRAAHLGSGAHFSQIPLIKNVESLVLLMGRWFEG
jgi:hypothetical protein